jgi:hypothetical protein
MWTRKFVASYQTALCKLICKNFTDNDIWDNDGNVG